MAKISVTRALTEVKVLTDRISRAIGEGVYVSVVKGIGEHAKPNVAGETVESLTARIDASFKTVESLTVRRDSIKAAIISSNATTEVTIAGKKMTVAEAIDRKSTVNLHRMLLDVMRRQYTMAQGAVDQMNAKLQGEIDQLITSLVGKDKSKVDEAQINALTAPLRNERQGALLDPKGILSIIGTKTTELEQFMAEVDFVLSEANAKTEIEIAD